MKIQTQIEHYFFKWLTKVFVRCWFHKWDVYSPHAHAVTFRKCRICNRKQYKVYTDSGVLSCWLDLDYMNAVKALDKDLRKIFK